MEEVALNEQVTAACLGLASLEAQHSPLQLPPACSCCLAAVQGPEECCVCLQKCVSAMRHGLALVHLLHASLAQPYTSQPHTAGTCPVHPPGWEHFALPGD